MLAVGDSIFLLHPDVRPLAGAGVEVDGEIVLGPRLQAVMSAVERAAQAGDTLHLTGETGTGKDLAARRFHDAGPRRKGPFIAVNCAAIPAPLAERLLFGARRGAYSGADSDTEGYLTSAHKGTLFLDELGELPPEVQAKLLRAVESREVLPLGASHARTVDFALSSASQGELRARIAEKLFRDDLYYRLCQNEVEVPPLRERLEEAPYLVETILRREKRTPHASLIEAVLRRSWPGNLRELVHATVAAARASGDKLVRAEHLPAKAGTAVGRADDDQPEQLPDDEAIVDALKKEQGNVVRAARALGLHRNQLRRWLSRNKIDPKIL